MGDIDTAAVLAKIAKAPEHGRIGVGGNDIDAEDVRPHRTVVQHPAAARVGGDHPADRRIGREIDREMKPEWASCVVHCGEAHPGRYHGRRIGNIDMNRLVQKVEREHDDVAVDGWNRRSDESGVRSLGKKSNAGLKRLTNDLAEFVDVRWQCDSGRDACPAACRNLVSRTVRRVRHLDMSGEGGEIGWGHWWFTSLA